MSDTSAAPSSQPSTPAPAAPETKTHHAALQPREQGKFAGPPGAKPPEAAAPATPPQPPKKWRVGDREYDNPDEVAAIAAQKDVDRKALVAYHRKAMEAEARLAALQKDKRQAFQTPEEAEEFAVNLIRQRMEEESLTPEQRALRKYQREAEEYKQRLAEREEQERKSAEEQRVSQVRQKLAADVQGAMDAAGLPKTEGNFRRVVAVLRANFQAGVHYPPEVVARQVQQRWREETQVSLKGLSLSQRLELLPDLIEQLEQVEDPAVLKRFSKLGERLRRLNLEGLGVAPPGDAPAPAASGGGGSGRHSKPESEWTVADWEEEFKARARA